ASLHGKAIARLKPIIAQDPGPTPARLLLRNAHVSRAVVLDRLGRYGQAVLDWAQAIDLDAGELRSRLHESRASSMAQCKQDPNAAKDVDSLTADKNTPAVVLYNAACILAALSVKEANKDHGRQAVAFLRRAAAAGYFREPAMARKVKSDPDL